MYVAVHTQVGGAVCCSIIVSLQTLSPYERELSVSYTDTDEEEIYTDRPWGNCHRVYHLAQFPPSRVFHGRSRLRARVAFSQSSIETARLAAVCCRVSSNVLSARLTLDRISVAKNNKALTWLGNNKVAYLPSPSRLGTLPTALLPMIGLTKLVLQARIDQPALARPAHLGWIRCIVLRPARPFKVSLALA